MNEQSIFMKGLRILLGVLFVVPLVLSVVLVIYTFLIRGID